MELESLRQYTLSNINLSTANQILSEELLGWENAALEFGVDHIKTLIAIDSLIVEPSFLAYLLHSCR